MVSNIVNAEELRAAIARSNIPKYVVAAHARVNPIRLSAILNEREEARPDEAERILEAVEALRGGRRR